MPLINKNTLNTLTAGSGLEIVNLRGEALQHYLALQAISGGYRLLNRFIRKDIELDLLKNKKKRKLFSENAKLTHENEQTYNQITYDVEFENNNIAASNKISDPTKIVENGEKLDKDQVQVDKENSTLYSGVPNGDEFAKKLDELKNEVPHRKILKLKDFLTKSAEATINPSQEYSAIYSPTKDILGSNKNSEYATPEVSESLDDFRMSDIIENAEKNHIKNLSADDERPSEKNMILSSENIIKDITTEILKGKDVNILRNFVGKEKSLITKKVFSSKNKVSFYDTIEDKESYKKYYEQRIKSLGGYRFFIEKLHGRVDNMPFKKNPVSNNQQPGFDYLNRRVFTAFIDNFYDSYDVETSNAYNFIGRAEGVPIYKQTTRKFVIEFTIISDYEETILAVADKVANSEDQTLSSILKNINRNVNIFSGTGENDLRGLNNNTSMHGSTYFETPETSWQKLTFLAQCCYPYYRIDGKMKEQPLIRIRIGDFFDLNCMITSLQYETNALNGPIMNLLQTNLGQQPMAYKVTLNAIVIHDYEPNSNYFGFYYRRQFDTSNAEKREMMNSGNGIYKVSSNFVVNSPISYNTSGNLKNQSTIELNESRKKVKTIAGDLEKPENNLNAEIRKQKLEEMYYAMAEIKKTEELLAEPEYKDESEIQPINSNNNNNLGSNIR